MRRRSWALAALPMCLALVLGVDSTTDLSFLPSCGLKCLTDAIQNSTCLVTNTTCICGSISLREEMTACVLQTCSIEESLDVKNTSLTLCGSPIRNKTSDYFGVLIGFQIVAGLFIIQRFGFKLYVHIGMTLDDWFVLVCFFLSIPITVLGIFGLVQNGMGQDIWTLPASKIDNFGRSFYISEVFYFSEVMFLKLAMLFFYLRVFQTRTVRRVLWWTVLVTSLFGTTFIFLTIFQCTPINYFWVSWNRHHNGSCVNLNALGWSNASLSIALDFWMLGIPLSQLKSLNLNWKKKIGVAVMFCVGFIFTIVSILRLQSLIYFRNNSKNPTWDFHETGLWSTVEIQVGIICNCMPSMRLFLVRVFSWALRLAHIKSNDKEENTPIAMDVMRRPEQLGDIIGRDSGIYEVDLAEGDEAKLVRWEHLDREGSHPHETV
ncbi:hypothetical protein EDB81DRAFT_934068 [Dactylonectria macrodidyma]|uniref:CFEM domain-containing protein n=1 Tax=Dactylonectria macrodidyma TaxID=307937 RepID=A0A9P9EWA3_9HYPO|nr:hypothetical protein EDB81DRAFT_934068 [Dactylonectria macrodidyma]